MTIVRYAIPARAQITHAVTFARIPPNIARNENGRPVLQEDGRYALNEGMPVLNEDGTYARNEDGSIAYQER